MTTNIAWLCQLVHDRAGIVLNEEKTYLITSRLHDLVNNSAMKSLDSFLTQVRAQPFGHIHQEIIELLTTNETFFFRDVAPFDALKKELIPAIIERRSAEKKLRIWCAAASTGQEPYSVNMILHDNYPKLRDWDVTILATDLSSKVINRGKIGFYTQQEIERGLPPLLFKKHFDPVDGGYLIKGNLRENIEFKVMNLLDSWFNIGTFDIILMRNVLIYFDNNTKIRLFHQTKKVLAADGYLLLGSAESPLNLDNAYVRYPFERGGIYRLLHSNEAPPINPKSDRYPTIQDPEKT